MREHYITATLALLKSGEPVSEVFAGLRRTLRAHDHEQLLLSIARGILRRLTDRTSAYDTRIVVASEHDVEVLAGEISAHLASLGVTKATPSVVVDTTLVGGVVVEHNARRIDASYKRALRSLYERVTE